jgi:hypothetical protein
VPGGQGRLVIAHGGVCAPKQRPWTSARPFSRRAKQRWGKQRVTSVGCTRNTAWRSHSAPQHGRVGLHHRTRVPRNEWLPSSAGRVPFCAIHSTRRASLALPFALGRRVPFACASAVNHGQSWSIMIGRGPWPISSPVSVSVSARLSRALAARAFEA